MINGQTRIVAIQKLHHQYYNEKCELQNLNDNFDRYIQRVKDLENKNRELRSQIDALKQNWGKFLDNSFDSIKIKDTYSKDLASLRKQLDNNAYNEKLAQVQATRAEYDKSSFEHQINFTNTFIILDQNHPSLCKQELERSKAELDRLTIQVNNKKQEIEERKNEMKQQLDHVQVLIKKLDNELMARVAAQIEVETCREELLFMKPVYEEEYNELATLGTFQIDVGQFYQTELTRAIANIRKDYELLVQEQYHQWEGYYTIKTEQIQIEIIEQKRKKEEASRSGDVGMIDMKMIQLELSENRKSYTTLQAEYMDLTKRLNELEEDLEMTRFRRDPKLIMLDRELAMLQAQYNEYQAANSSMHENNVSLQFEISTYRRLLQGSLTVTVTKTREIALIWTNSLTANFSAIDSKASSVLQWAENVKVATATTSLPTTCNGPEGWSNVSFSAVYYTTNEQIIIEAKIDNQFHFYNYGCYQVTIYYPNSKTAIGTFEVHIEPKDDICMPKQFIIRDSMNTILVNTSVQLRLNGEIVFTDTSNSQGIVNLPQTLSNNCYDVEINTNHDQYKIAKFQRIVFKSRGAESVTYFIYRQMQTDEVEFLLTWGAHPSDMDSHVFVSDGRHVYFSNKQEPNISLDYDCREGGGPETMKVKLEPNMKYIYAVHRYTKDGELAKSDATVTISTNEILGSDSPFTVVRVPYVNQPEANFWVVCQIDGTTKKFKFFDHKFENEDDCKTDEVVRKYYNA